MPQITSKRYNFNCNDFLGTLVSTYTLDWVFWLDYNETILSQNRNGKHINTFFVNSWGSFVFCSAWIVSNIIGRRLNSFATSISSVSLAAMLIAAVISSPLHEGRFFIGPQKNRLPRAEIFCNMYRLTKYFHWKSPVFALLYSPLKKYIFDNSSKTPQSFHKYQKHGFDWELKGIGSVPRAILKWWKRKSYMWTPFLRNECESDSHSNELYFTTA